MFDIKEGGINLEKQMHGHVDRSRRNLLAIRDIRALKRILIECVSVFIHFVMVLVGKSILLSGLAFAGAVFDIQARHSWSCEILTVRHS